MKTTATLVSDIGTFYQTKIDLDANLSDQVKEQAGHWLSYVDVTAMITIFSLTFANASGNLQIFRGVYNADEDSIQLRKVN